MFPVSYVRNLVCLNNKTRFKTAKQHLRTCSSNSNDPYNAFIIHGINLKTTETGLLAGLTVGVKDLYDIAEYKTGFGNPAWQATHEVESITAPCVEALLQAGACIVGKTHMDELAYSLNGENIHYGTPKNPAAPDRVPGGSSSGSAVCVASGEADIGLGSDTAGSVRVPASYCGIWGFRPTHNKISMHGSRPLAPSFDTVGWFTRSAEILAKVGEVLLDGDVDEQNVVDGWMVGTDAFDLADEQTSKAIYEKIAGFKPQFVEILGGEPKEMKIASAEGLGELYDWFSVFRTIQGREVWQCHGDWVSENNPDFGRGIKERFTLASQIDDTTVLQATHNRQRIRSYLDEVIGNKLLMIPTAPGAAPYLNTPAEQLDVFRQRALSLTSIAGLAGYPQVNIPIASVDGCPVGVSIISRRDSDKSLLNLAIKIEKLLQQNMG